MAIKREVKVEHRSYNSFIWGVIQLILFIIVIWAIVGLLKPSESATIDTSGSSQTSVMPDKAYVYLGYDNEASTASEAQSANAGVIDAIQNSLKGISNIKVETSSYSVYPVYSYTENVPKVISYKASHILKITSNNTDNLGNIVDTASNAGANNIQNIQFDLSDAKQKEVRQALLSAAVNDARQKADIIAKAAKVTIWKPLHISESWNYPMPLYAAGVSSMDKSASVPTQISPQELSLSVSVSVSWKI